MDCPTCGYIMDDFDKECPRCVRLKAMGRDPAAASAPATQPDSRASTTATVTQVARDTARSVKVEPLFKGMDEPDLGWPLTILLWSVLILNALAILLIFVFASQVPGAQAGSAVISALIRIACVIGMLRCSRFAFYAYCFFSVAPAVLSLMLGGGANLFVLLFNIAPAIAIFFLALGKWDEFE